MMIQAPKSGNSHNHTPSGSISDFFTWKPHRIPARIPTTVKARSNVRVPTQVTPEASQGSVGTHSGKITRLGIKVMLYLLAALLAILLWPTQRINDEHVLPQLQQAKLQNVANNLEPNEQNRAVARDKRGGARVLTEDQQKALLLIFLVINGGKRYS